MEDPIRYIVYVGCYTLPNQADPFGDSGGIPHDKRKVGTGVVALNLSSRGKLSYASKEVATGIVNPSYLTVDQEKSRLFVTSEVEEGRLYSFALDPTNPTNLELRGNGVATKGGFPCHVSSFQSATNGTIVLVSNYGNKNGGVVSQFTTGKGGALTLKEAIPHGFGSQGDVSRQMESHAHCCVSISDTEVICCDLGADALVQYKLEEGRLLKVGGLALPLGSGPRSLCFSPTNPQIAVVSLEMAAKIQIVRLREHDHCLELVGEPVSILPQDWPHEHDGAMRNLNKGRWASDALWSPGGEFVFAAARLHNHINVFRWDNDRNELSFRHRVATNGITPRCLAVSPCGNILLVAHQHSHDVSSFKIDSLYGMLTPIDRIEAPLASCVAIIEL